MSDVDKMSESKAERVRRVRIATELLPALGLAHYRDARESPVIDADSPDVQCRTEPHEVDPGATSQAREAIAGSDGDPPEGMANGNRTDAEGFILDGIRTAMWASEATWYTPTIVGRSVLCACGFASHVTRTVMGNGAYQAVIDAEHHASLRFHHANCPRARTHPDSETRSPSGAPQA